MAAVSACYRLDGSFKDGYRLVPADTAEIGRSHYLVVHPDAIRQCDEVPEGWNMAVMLGAHYIVPSSNAEVVDKDELDALAEIMKRVDNGE